ncbi:MAG: glycosyltransferase, partial [Oscillospiraceae bacterium]|nr:glycosyltransferase [Oscillospiraceae bacterium]
MLDKNLNVCLMNDSFPPLIDGVVNVVTNYADIITNGLGQATVVTPTNPNAEEDKFPYDVVRYRSVSITEKMCGYRMGYPFSSSALDGLKAAEFDIIHSHCPFASTVMARVLREKTNVPIIMTYHTKFDVDIHRALPNDAMAQAAIKFVVGNISACDEVWTVSRGAGENLKSLGYEGDFVVMENGVDFPKGRADKDAAAELRSDYD